jgi:hypothetical protein
MGNYGKAIGLMSLWCILALPVSLVAGEKRINVQGKLTQADGVTAIAGTHDITLRLYDTVTSTSGIVFAEKHAGVNLGTTGLFNLMLGQGTVLTPPNKAMDTVSFNRQYYVGIQVDNDAAEIGNRQALGASAYALGSIADFNVGKNLTISGKIAGTNGTFTSSVTCKAADFSVGTSTLVVKAGNVGIGCSAPAFKLTIDANGPFIRGRRAGDILGCPLTAGQ